MVEAVSSIELDLAQFRRGREEVITSFALMGRSAEDAGRIIDGAFGNEVEIKGAAQATADLLGIKQEVVGLLEQAPKLANVSIAVAGGAIAAREIGDLRSQAANLLTTVEPLKLLTFDADGEGAKGELDQIIQQSLEALRGAKPLESIPVNLDGAIETGQELATIAEEATGAAGAATGLRTALGATGTSLGVVSGIATGTVAVLAAIGAGLGVAAFKSGDLDESLGRLSDSASEFGTEFGRLIDGLIQYGAEVSEAIGLTDALNASIDLLADGVGGAAGFIGDLADQLLGVEPTAEEFAQRIEESAANLSELEAEAIAAANAAGTFEGSQISSDIATRRYNLALEEHNALIAESERRAELAAIAQGELDVSVGLTAESLRRSNSELREGAGEFDDYAEAVANAADGAREAAAAIADAELAIEQTGDEAELTEEQIARLNQVFAEFEQQTEDNVEQGNRLADTFDFIRRNSAAAARQLETQDRVLQELIDGAEAFEEQQRQAQEASERAAEVSREAFVGLADTFSDLVGVEGRELVNFFENLDILAGNLGDRFQEVFSGLANQLGLSAEQIEGFFGLVQEGFDIFGVELESVIGSDATEIISRFARLSDAEVGVLRDGFDSLIGLFGFGSQQVSAFGESSISTLTDVNASVGELQGALGGVNRQFAATGRSGRDKRATAGDIRSDSWLDRWCWCGHCGWRSRGSIRGSFGRCFRIRRWWCGRRHYRRHWRRSAGRQVGSKTKARAKKGGKKSASRVRPGAS